MNTQPQMQDPLAQLKGIALPSDVSAWPLAWPWWAMLITVVASIALFIYLHKKNAWRRAALAHLKAIDHPTPRENLQAYNRLLKQVAIQRCQQTSAHLSATPWLEFLDQHLKQPLFIYNIPQFANAIDDPSVELDVKQVKEICEKWIKEHTC